MKKATMRDIARAVGTSAVTVSRAMSGKPGMSDRLRSRILKKAAEMGYEYPGSERMVPKANLDIGILIPDRHFDADSFYADMYKRVIRKLSEQGHFGLLEILDAEDEKRLVLPRMLTASHVDGLILLGEPSKAYYRMIAQAGIPTVFLDFYDEQANADAVTGDNVYGAYRLSSHLIRLGHRKIAFVGNVKATSSIMDRFLGYCRALLANDLPFREDWMISDRKDDGELIPLVLPKEMPTAFVCNCDITARNMIETLLRAGYRVPEDVSVTGFDDFPPPGKNEQPALSTFRVDTDGMIDLAVKHLLERCAGVRKPFGRTVVGGQPVYRNSEQETVPDR